MIHYEKLVAIEPRLRLDEKLLPEHEMEFRNPSEFRQWLAIYMPDLKIYHAKTLADVEEAPWNMFVLARYVAEGQRVFRIEPGLARLLLDTSLPAVKGEEFQLPFPTIYLEFPGRLFVMPGVQETMIGCYLMDVRPRSQHISLEFVFEPKKERPGIREFGFHLNVNTPVGQPINWGDLFETFSESMKGPRSYPNLELLRKASTFLSELMPLVVNAVLYSTSESPDIIEGVTKWRRLGEEKRDAKTSKQHERLRREQMEVPQTDQHRLGANIPVVYGAPKAADASAGARTARKLLKRLRVRGHWRWFHHGVGRTLRKHRFVAPFWRGPADLAELLKRKYQLK